MDIEKDTYKVLHDFITQAIGEKPYLMEEGFVRPNGGYVACKLMNVNKLTTGAHRMPPTDPSGVERFAVEMLLRWHIHAYREMSIEKLTAIAYRLNDRNVRSILSDGGLGYKGHSQITQTTISRDGVEREKQAYFVVEFYYVYEDTVFVGKEVPSVIEEAEGVAPDLKV